MMLDLEVLSQFSHHLVVQIRSIISNELFWDSVTTNDVLLDEAGNNLLGHIRIGSNFNPLGKVIDCYQDEVISIRNGRLDSSDHIDAPH